MSVNIAKELSEIKEMVKGVYNLVIGDDNTKSFSIMTRTERLELKVAEISAAFTKVKYAFVGSMIPAGYGIYQFIQSFIPDAPPLPPMPNIPIETLIP